MSNELRTLVRLIVVCCAVLCQTAQGAETNAAQFGFEQRIRNEDWNNLFDFNGARDDEREQIRYRTRVWASIPLSSHMTVNAGLNSETNQRIGQHNERDEIVFDTANLELRDLLVKGLSMKIGRQDLLRGEGFILAEGTPGDGSRTAYFNAVDIAYTFGRSTVEAMGIVAPKNDRMLPRICDQHRLLLERDEQAIGLYFTTKWSKRTAAEAYLFRKREARDSLGLRAAGSYPDRRVDTAGGRLTREWTRRWSSVSEGAVQWGVQQPATPIRAWAGYTCVKRAFQGGKKPYVLGGLWLLSGDDPRDAGTVRGWDPLFSRFPRWGDLELYSQLQERGVGYATNQTRTHVEGGFSPHRSLNWKFIYYRVGAMHPFAGSPKMFGAGLHRGDNLQTRVDFRINSRLRGHIDYELLFPGDFYASRQPAYFLRFEVLADFRHTALELRRRFSR